MGIDIYCSLEKAQSESMSRFYAKGRNVSSRRCRQPGQAHHDTTKQCVTIFGKKQQLFFKATNKQLFNTNNKNAQQTHMHPHHPHFDLRHIMWPNSHGLFGDDERRSLVGQAKKINATWLAYHIVGSKFESNGRFAMLMLSSVLPGRGV